MGDYLFGEKVSTTYTQFVAIGGAADRAGIHATTQKAIWTDDGEGGTNAFPLTAARDALQITSTNRLEFNDDNAYIYGASSGVLTTSASASTVIGTALFDLNASAGITIDGTTVSIDGTGASNFTATGGNLTLSTASSGEMFLTPVNYIQVASGKKLQFAGTNDYVSGTGSALTIGSGGDISLVPGSASDVSIPSGKGVQFGDSTEKIEGDGTDLTISSGADIDLTASGDVNIPANIGLTFGDDGEKIEGNGTELTINSSADINLTCATGDINVPASIGLTFGVDTSKIEYTASGTKLELDSAGYINVTSTVNGANALYLRANGGASETIKIHSDQGTAVTEGAASVCLLSDAGGVELRSTANLANAINLTVDGGTTSSMTLFNDQGTSVTEGSASIQLLSDAGGIGIKSTSGLANAILLTADGGTSETIKLHADQGTSESSIELTSDAGGVDINVAAGKTFAVDAGILSLNSTASSNITMTANTGSTTPLTISATNSNGSYSGDLVLNADGVVHIRSDDTTSSAGGAGIQIGTDLANVDVSIGNAVSDVRIGDDLAVAGDQTVAGDLTVTGTINGTHATASTTLSGTTPTLTLQNTTNEDSQLDNAVNTTAGRETKIVFKGERSGDEVNILASLVVGHEGTADDQKGQMQFFVNSGSQSDTALSNVMNIMDTGFVGIGTTAPDMPLEISHANTTAITGANIASNAVLGLHIDHTADTDAAGSVIKLSSNTDGCQSAIAHIQVDDNDADLAFYTDKAGTLTEAMRIDNSQNVGIGTTSPDTKLEVEDDTNHVYLSVKASAQAKTAGIQLNALEVGAGTPRIWEMQHIGTYDDSGEDNRLRFIHDGSERCCIDAGGQVGIGTASPENALHITGVNQFIKIEEDPTDTTITDNQSLGGIQWKHTDATQGSGGTAGIYAKIIGEGHGAGGYGAIRIMTGLAGAALSNSITCLSQHTGINQSDPVHPLDVFGIAAEDQYILRVVSTTSTDADTWGVNIDFSATDPNNATQLFLECEDSAAVRYRLYSNGQIRSLVHYATAAGSTQTALYVDDSGYFGKVTSIRDHKKKIKDMEDISWIYDIRPVNFEYKVMETIESKRPDDKVSGEEGKIETVRTGKRLDIADGKKQYGMIAEELLEVDGAEDLLEYDSDGKLSGISYNRFVPILIKAIQELSAKVTALENA
jgi:hypothetical protein